MMRLTTANLLLMAFDVFGMVGYRYLRMKLETTQQALVAFKNM
jgi:hypothetical protein